MTTTNCTCGCTESHVIATRITADGVTIKCWSDGDVTDRLSVALKGLGRSRTTYARESDRKALLDIMDDLSLLDYCEIVPAIKLARRDRRTYRYTSETARRKNLRFLILRSE